jgi:beta-fructofuranosidase
MYFLDGMNPNEIGDFDVIEHEGQLHVFYLVLPTHDSVGHLVSDDGINWTQLPDAIRTGDPGEFDADQIWTMGVCKADDGWIMLYTANENHGTIQTTGLATSDDLIHWTKADNNPVARPDPRWYEAEQSGNYRMDWRDPQIVRHGGKYHAFLCARQNTGLLNHRGCAGYFTSSDGKEWEVQPPASTPGNCYDYECPSVFELEGRFYMAAIHGGHDRMTWRVSDKIEGPYHRLYDDSLLPGKNMSVRPCFWRGRGYLFHWTRGARDWGTRHTSFACLSSPKIVRATDDGLVVESFDWSSLYSAKSEELTAETASAPSCGKWDWEEDTLVGYSSFGTGIWLTESEYEDFEITANVQVDWRGLCEFGIVFRADETGDRALYARCIPGRYSVELVKQIYNRRNGPESLWRGRSVEQAYHFTPSPDGRYHLRLIAFGPNIEFNVNGRLVLSQLSMPRRNGRLGVFLEDGKGEFRNISVTPLKSPKTNWDR